MNATKEILKQKKAAARILTKELAKEGRKITRRSLNSHRFSIEEEVLGNAPTIDDYELISS